MGTKLRIENGKLRMGGVFLLLVALLLLVGCVGAGYQSASQYAPPAPLPGQSAADAQATLTAWELRQAATAEWNRQATAVSQSATSVAIRSTEEAQAVATGTAQAEMSARMATSDALAVQATTQALFFQATRESLAISATATSEAQNAAVVEALRRDEEARLAQQRADEQIRQERARLVNAWLPVVVMAFLMVFVGLIAAAIYMKMTQNKPVTIVHDNRQVTVLPDGNGGFRMLPPSRPLALPAPQEGELVEDDVEDGEFEPVLDALEGEQAILIHGAKGTGKTTLLMWLMSQRENAIILDPHGAPSKWPNCHMIGAGRNFAEIEETLRRVETLMMMRYVEIGDGSVEEGAHDRLTLFIDEYRAITKNIPSSAQVIATLLTEARKVNIDIVLVSHSKNVQALGLDGEGDLRDGFAFVYLSMVRGKRQAHVAYGMDGHTAVSVSLPGAFDPRHVRPLFPHNRAAALLGGNLFVAPAVEDEDGIDSQWGFIPRDEVAMILDERANNIAQHGRELRRKICNDIYGFEGGERYQKIKFVLDSAQGAPYNRDDVMALTEWLIQSQMDDDRAFHFSQERQFSAVSGD